MCLKRVWDQLTEAHEQVDILLMRREHTFAILGAMILSVLTPLIHTCHAEIVVVNKAFNGREVKVRLGGLIRVELEQLGAAGYIWAIQDLDTEHFQVLSDETQEVNPKSDVTGAPVLRSWIIQTKGKGRSELRFLHYRPWEGQEKASESFVLKVRIL
jgi:predicted secreted protein